MQDLISFWTGSQTNLEQMIANAVPVKLAEYVGSCLMKYCKSQQKQESQFWSCFKFNKILIIVDGKCDNLSYFVNLSFDKISSFLGLNIV